MEFINESGNVRKNEYQIIKNAYLYLFGMSLSNIGSVMYGFAIGLYILKMTGSALNFSLTLVLSIIPRIVFLPFAGVIADTIERKKIIIFTDLINGFMLLLLFIYLKYYEFHLILIYSSVLFLTIQNTFFSVAMDASLPNIVDEKRLIKINSFKQITDSGSSILGPIFGGMFYATTDINFFIFINGISFVISGCSEIFMNFSVNNTNRAERKDLPFFNTMKDGIEYIKKNKRFLDIYIYFLLVNFFVLSNVIITPYIIITLLNMSSLQYGIIQCATPCGLFFMSILLNVLNKQKMFIKLGYSNIMIGFLIFLMGIPALNIIFTLSDLLIMIYYITINFTFGVILVSIRIPLSLFLQKEIQEGYRGRVLGLLTSLSRSILPISSILFGFLIDTVHPTIIALICGLSIVVIGFHQLYDKQVNEIFSTT